MSSRSKTLIEWSGGRLVRRSPKRFVIEELGELVEECESFGDAVATVAELTDEYTGAVTYSVKREALWEVADEYGLEGLFPESSDGWVRLDQYWVPANMNPESNLFEHLDPVYSNEYGGWCADIYGWEGVFLLWWRAPEGFDYGWEMLGRVSQTEACAVADDKVAVELDDWGMSIDPYLGLGNLPVAERVALPPGAVAWRTYSAYSEYGESLEAEVTVYRVGEGDTTELLVTDSGSSTVVGRYRSEGSLVSAIDEPPGFSVERGDE
jgi:hypothetical protein